MSTKKTVTELKNEIDSVLELSSALKSSDDLVIPIFNLLRKHNFTNNTQIMSIGILLISSVTSQSPSKEYFEVLCNSTLRLIEIIYNDFNQE